MNPRAATRAALGIGGRSRGDALALASPGWILHPPLAMKLGGHLWTIAPNLRHRVRPHRAPEWTPWSTAFADPRLGELTLRGFLSRPPEGASRREDLVVLVHGLGGSPDSQYVVRTAQAAAKIGMSSLRLALRGADRQGEDFYHAGLTADLEAALASPELAPEAGIRRIYVLGFSLGGHMTLRYALAPSDPRVRAVASLCAPLDLGAGAKAIDQAAAYTYRRYLLGGLLEMYAEVAARRPVPTPLAVARRIATMREWDARTVVPRFGFTSADDYYTSMSVGPRLGELAVPTLIVAAEHDPMVPAPTLRPSLERPPPQATVRWLDRGGHVGFPRGALVDLDRAAEGDIFDQLVGWLAAH